MAKGSGGASGRAIGKSVRVVGGQRIDVTSVSNQAANVKPTAEDRQEAEKRVPLSDTEYLKFMGLSDTRAATVKALAKERAVLRYLQSEVGGNILSQWGNNRWDVTSGRTISKSLDEYLWRRVSGQRSRWTGRNR